MSKFKVKSDELVTLWICSLADDGDNSVFEGSEGGSSVPRTPTEGTLTPVSTPAEDLQR